MNSQEFYEQSKKCLEYYKEHPDDKAGYSKVVSAFSESIESCLSQLSESCTKVFQRLENQMELVKRNIEYSDYGNFLIGCMDERQARVKIGLISTPFPMEDLKYYQDSETTGEMQTTSSLRIDGSVLKSISCSNFSKSSPKSPLRSYYYLDKVTTTPVSIATSKGVGETSIKLKIIPMTPCSSFWTHCGTITPTSKIAISSFKVSPAFYKDADIHKNIEALTQGDSTRSRKGESVLDNSSANRSEMPPPSQRPSGPPPPGPSQTSYQSGAPSMGRPIAEQAPPPPMPPSSSGAGACPPPPITRIVAPSPKASPASNIRTNTIQSKVSLKETDSERRATGTDKKPRINQLLSKKVSPLGEGSNSNSASKTYHIDSSIYLSPPPNEIFDESDDGSEIVPPPPSDLENESENDERRPTMPSADQTNCLYKVQAIYEYKGSNQMELSFNAGDTIHVLEENENQWDVGFLKGCEGFFPRNFVKRIN